MTDPEFDRLVAEALAHQFSGWDFSWLKERWISGETPWDYRAEVLTRLPGTQRLLDMGTGGGEFLSSLPGLPASVIATEGYLPNVRVAARRLHPLGISVTAIEGEEDRQPFANGSFDLVINRHESFQGGELRRILMPSGTFLSQQVGGRDNIDLNCSLAPETVPQYSDQTLQYHMDALQAAGLELVDAREAYIPELFKDIGAVVFYLKIITWQIPGFEVEQNIDRLYALHCQMKADGGLQTFSHRLLLIARKPLGV